MKEVVEIAEQKKSGGKFLLVEEKEDLREGKQKEVYSVVNEPTQPTRSVVVDCRRHLGLRANTARGLPCRRHVDAADDGTAADGHVRH